MKELFYQFKNLYRNLAKDIDNKNFVDTRTGGASLADAGVSKQAK